MNIQEFIKDICNNMVKTKIIVFFYNNQYSVDTHQGLSLWLNEDSIVLEKNLKELEKSGILFLEYGMYSYKPKEKYLEVIREFINTYNNDQNSMIEQIKDLNQKSELEEKLELISKELYEKNRILFILQEVNNILNSTKELYEMLNDLSALVKLHLDADSFSVIYSLNNLNGIFNDVKNEIVRGSILELLEQEEGKGNAGIEDMVLEEYSIKAYIYNLKNERDQNIGKVILSKNLDNMEEFEVNKEIMYIIASLLSQTFEKHNYFVEKIKKEALESDLNVAKRIQTSFIPDKFPLIDGYEFAALYEPARMVGGDYYDWFKVNEHDYSIVIGDVSGKGTGAALFMVKARENFRIYSRNNFVPSSVLENVNNSLANDVDVDKFITCFYIILDSQENRIYYSNAGHDPLIIVRNGEVEELKIKGAPLGIMNDSIYISDELELVKDDLLVLYTDGVVESRNNKKEFYGFERFHKVLKGSYKLEPKAIIKAVYEDVKRFIKEAPPHDDFTILIIKYSG